MAAHKKKMNKIHNLLKKLQALAERGEGGEAENAKRMLYELMEKHGITLDDIQEEQPKLQELSYGGMEKVFVQQVLASEGINNTRRYVRSYSKKKVILFDSTDTQFRFLESKVKFYWKLYKSERKKFYEAFVHANDLGRRLGEDEPEREYTREEIRHIMEIMRMAQGIRRESMYKALDYATA